MTEYGRIHTDGSRSGGQPVLLPCPFCGGVQIKAFHHIDRGWGASWHVECVAEECGNSTCHHDTEATAIAAWNKRQPTHSNIFDASDVQKHTLIVDQDYSSHTVRVKSLDDSQTTQSDALLDAEGVKLYWYRQGKEDGADAERAKIIAYARGHGGNAWSRDVLYFAEKVEAGEHLK